MKRKNKTMIKRIQKKAQIQSQIFIYVFALLIISLILFFGVKAISKFKGDTDKVALGSFVTDLNSKIRSVTSEYDSIQEVNLDLPKQFKQVCFTDKDTQASEVSIPIIKNYIQDNSKSNVFILKEQNILEQELKTGEINVIGPTTSPNFLCVPNINGKLKFMAKGKGKYAEIYSP